MLKSKLGKLFFYTISTLTVFMLITDYNDVKDERKLQHLIKEKELLQVAARLNDELSSFQQILIQNDAEALNAEAQTEILNNTLQPIVMKIADEHPGVGLGYYSKSLDRSVAIGPLYESSFLRKVSTPEALEIYQTEKPQTLRIEHSVIWDGKPILAVHYPLKRNGEIIGHAFANSKIEDIEAAYQSALVSRFLRTGLVWLTIVFFVSLIFYRTRKVIEELIKKIETEDDDPSKLNHFPEILPILNTVIKLRDKIKADNHKLAEMNNKLFKLMDICPLAILELDKAGTIISLNKPMVDFYQGYLPYKKEMLIGTPIQAISSELGISFSDSFAARILSGEEIRNEFITRLDRHWIVNGIPIYDHYNTLSGCYIFYHDITKYEAFKNQMARLESLNAIGETASSVAHELRNPATTIKGFIQLMSLKSNEQQGQYYTIILEELERMNDIIEDFLSLARNRFTPKLPSDLNEILLKIYPLLLADTTKNDIELHYNLCENIEVLELNPKEMRQLILNIVRNGIDATSRKGHITISTKNTQGGIELIVSDTGSGIPKESMDNIFEPFHTSKKNGTGLGLAVCKNIIEDHGGKIDVISEVGQGTTFIIYLPKMPRDVKRLDSGY